MTCIDFILSLMVLALEYFGDTDEMHAYEHTLVTFSFLSFCIIPVLTFRCARTGKQECLYDYQVHRQLLFLLPMHLAVSAS